METLLFHPKLVHLPIALGVLMPLVAAGAWIAWWRGWLPRRGWFFAVALQTILVGSGVAALQSGEAEEDRVESVVPEQLIEAHEEAAELFVQASGGVLVVMLLAAVLASRRSGLPLAAVATVGTFVVFGLGYRTGDAGGSLVYEHGAAQAYGGAAAPTVDAGAPEVARERDEDDD